MKSILIPLISLDFSISLFQKAVSVNLSLKIVLHDSNATVFVFFNQNHVCIWVDVTPISNCHLIPMIGGAS